MQFSDISSKASELGICTYTGQWLEIESNTRWLPKTYAIFVISLPLSLCHIMHAYAQNGFSLASFLISWPGGMAGQVEDPFEQPENTARAIYARQLMRISEAIRMTCFRITSVHQNQSSILAELARPQTSQLIVKPSAPASAPTFNLGNYPPVGPQVHQARVRHPRPWIQHQSQNSVPRFNMGNFPPIDSHVPRAGTTHSHPLTQQNFSNTRCVSNPNSSKTGEPSKTYNGQGPQKWRPRSQRQV